MAKRRMRVAQSDVFAKERQHLPVPATPIVPGKRPAGVAVPVRFVIGLRPSQSDLVPVVDVRGRQGTSSERTSPGRPWPCRRAPDSTAGAHRACPTDSLETVLAAGDSKLVMGGIDTLMHMAELDRTVVPRIRGLLKSTATSDGDVRQAAFEK